MKNILRFLTREKGKKQDIEKIAEKELRENFDVIESLRKYDRGEKNISTAELKRRLPRIRVAP